MAAVTGARFAVRFCDVGFVARRARLARPMARLRFQKQICGLGKRCANGQMRVSLARRASAGWVAWLGKALGVL